MALRVWLPLNGDLKNKGLSNLRFANINATVSDTGKIGKCYSFDGDSYLTTPTSSVGNYTTSFTMSIWIKDEDVPATQTWRRLCGRGYHNQYHFDIYDDGRIRFWTTQDGTDTEGHRTVAYSTSSVKDGKWHHICGTFNGEKLRLYIDGILEKTVACSEIYSIPETQMYIGWIANGYKFKGLLNDFRLYDEALSTKEIKELSKGLICHYKLNNLDFINTDVSGNGYNTTSVGTLTLNNESPRYDKSAIFTGSQLLNVSIGNVLANSKDFTISGWFYHTDGTCYYAGDNANAITVALEKNRFFIYDSSGTAHVGTWNATDNVWQYLTLVHNSTAQTLTLYINGIQNQQISTNGTVYSKEVLNIGGRKNTGQFQGYMSDLRFYVTALSANDVKQLYEAFAIIDNKGNSYSYEFIEEE